MNFFLIWFFITFIINVLSAQQSGQNCIVERSQKQGICKPIYDCPSVVNDIQNRRSHTRCGFQGRTEIVCCPFVETSTKPPVSSLSSISDNARISVKKCDEYKSAVYEYVFSLSLAIGAERNKIPVDKCGHKTIPLIVGGQFAKAREFPHMALIGFDNGQGQVSWACGGSLISEKFVVTAGHCLYSKQYGEPTYVRLGELNILSNEDDARPQDLRILRLIPHPEYRTSSKYNDIALLELNQSIAINPYKRPACLPTSFEGEESKVIATGWGHTTWSGESSTHLQKVVLEKFTEAECNTSYASQINRRLRNGIQYATQICAGSKTENKDTCQGDSGGPIQVYHQNLYCMYTLIGVTSFGITCGNRGIPGVYTRIYPYVDWIENIVWG